MNLTYLEIDHQRSLYDSMASTEQRTFLERVSFCWLYHEHALEGIVLTERDIHRALEGRPCRNYCDGLTQHSLRSLRDAFFRVSDDAAAGQEVTLDWLRDLHTSLCVEGDEAAGRYRKRDTSPGVYNLDVAQASSISYYFHKFQDLYNDELQGLHPIRAAAAAHWEFMRVFPFDERSGFVGRLMMNMILMRHHYPPAIIHATDRHHYFAALNGHRDDLVPVLVEAVGSTLQAARAFSQAGGASRVA